MICKKCDIGISETPDVFYPVTPKGQDRIWWCESCIKRFEPELAKNIEEEKTTIERDLPSILGRKK